jgi:pilus assembly protein CpaB
MRRSSIFLLLGAVFLGLLAVFAARSFLGPQAGGGEAAPQVSSVTAVVVAKPMKFGDVVTPDKLKIINLPGALPSGAFPAVRDAVGDGSRTALRDIKIDELLLTMSITGGEGRMASSTLLGQDMRAVAVPVSETAGAGGFLAPGDRVDVFLTRTMDEGAAYTTAVVQGARVLAVGQIADTSKADPVIVKSATLEVTPAEAQRIALAQTIGAITLALRPTGDEARVPTFTTSAFEFFGGAGRPQPAAAPAPAGGGSAPAGPPVIRGPQVTIVRGTESTSYAVAR